MPDRPNDTMDRLGHGRIAHQITIIIIIIIINQIMIILIINIIAHPPIYFRVQVDRQDTHTAGIQRGQAVALHEGRG